MNHILLTDVETMIDKIRLGNVCSGLFVQYIGTIVFSQIMFKIEGINVRIDIVFCSRNMLFYRQIMKTIDIVHYLLEMCRLE